LKKSYSQESVATTFDAIAGLPMLQVFATRFGQTAPASLGEVLACLALSG
jgi:hypothetical protein